MEQIKEFDRILLNLEKCIVPVERILNTPSAKQGMSHELEVDLRIAGCEYIQTAGLLLQLPQVAMATAQVLFQRFYYAKSFIDFKVRPMAMACIFVAAKIEEDCRKIRDVVNVFHHLSQKRTGRPIVPMEYMGDEYFTLKPLVIKYERRLLKELGFCVHVKHPHKLIVTYLQILEMEKNATLAQKAWNYMNDSLRTNVFVRFSREAIACACIFLAARQLKIVLPKKPAWWTLFSVEQRDLENISRDILALYSRPRKNLEDLERDVAVLKIQLASTKHIEVKEVKLNKNEEAESSVAPSPSPSTHQDQPKGEEGAGNKVSATTHLSVVPVATVSSSSGGPSPSEAPSSSLTLSQDSSSAGATGSQKLTSSPVRNGGKQAAPKRSLSLSPSRRNHSSPSSSPSPKRRKSQSDRSRSRSPPRNKHKRNSPSPKTNISPIKFRFSSESHSEESYTLSPSPPPPPPPQVSLSSRENGLPRQYRQDYREHRPRHKHRSHKEKRDRRHRERDPEKERKKHRHRRDRDRDYYDIPDREKSHYSGSSLSRRERDFERDRDYYRKSDPSRYR